MDGADQNDSVIEGAAQMNSVIFHVIQDEAGSIQVFHFKICTWLMSVKKCPNIRTKNNNKHRTLHIFGR